MPAGSPAGWGRENAPENLGEAVGRSREDLIQLERKLKALAKEANAVRGLLGKHTLVASSVIHSLPHPQLGLKHPLTLTIEHLNGSTWRAGLADLALSEQARARSAAIQKLSQSLVSTFELLEQDPDRGPQTWERLQQIIYRRPPPRPPSFDPEPAASEAAEPPPTLKEWKESHEPEGEEAIARAWRAGATACFSGETDCPYRAPRLIQGWRRGYQALKRYLESGGLFSCASCCQVMRVFEVTASQKRKAR